MHRPLTHLPKRGRVALLAVPATGLALVAAACGGTGTTGSIYGGGGANTGSTSNAGSTTGGGSAGGTRYGVGALSVQAATESWLIPHRRSGPQRCICSRETAR